VAWLIGSFAPGNTQVQVITKRVGALTFASPYDNRQQIWAEAIREMKARPWVGYGPGDFPVSSLRTGSETSSVYALHAHNIWLTWGAEAGIPAVLLIIGLTGAVGFAARRASRGANKRGDRADRAIVAGVTAALITVVGQGFVDYTMGNLVVFVALWALVGALLVARREAYVVLETADDSEPVRAPNRIIQQTRAALIPRARTELLAATNGDPRGDYDPPAVAEKHDERLERRLAEQAEALRARRGRLQRLREALVDRERALINRGRELEQRAAQIEREHDERAEAQLLRAELDSRLSALAEREEALAARERLLDARSERLDARARDVLAAQMQTEQTGESPPQ
jgi:hypothetical protein